MASHKGHTYIETYRVARIECKKTLETFVGWNKFLGCGRRKVVKDHGRLRLRLLLTAVESLCRIMIAVIAIALGVVVGNEEGRLEQVLRNGSPQRSVPVSSGEETFRRRYENARSRRPRRHFGRVVRRVVEFDRTVGKQRREGNFFVV